MIDMTPLWNNLVENTEITSYLNEEEIVNAGFIPVKNPQTTIDGLNYLCCRRKIIPIMERNTFVKEYTKEKIIRLIKDRGFTHIRNVEMHSFPFFFDLGLPEKDAVCIMIEGFTKRNNTH